MRLHTLGWLYIIYNWWTTTGPLGKSSTYTFLDRQLATHDIACVPAPTPSSILPSGRLVDAHWTCRQPDNWRDSKALAEQSRCSAVADAGWDFTSAPTGGLTCTVGETTSHLLQLLRHQQPQQAPTNLDHGDMRIRSTAARPGTGIGDFSEALRVPAQRQAGRAAIVVQSCYSLDYESDIKGNWSPGGAIGHLLPLLYLPRSEVVSPPRMDYGGMTAETLQNLIGLRISPHYQWDSLLRHLQSTLGWQQLVDCAAIWSHEETSNA